MRHVTRVEVRPQGELITIVVVGDAFLRGMVRRMVAALIRVGKGQTRASRTWTALAVETPAFKGEAAPARGLTLWNVPMGPEREDQRREQDKASNRTE